jgi:hypothetical protein
MKSVSSICGCLIVMMIGVGGCGGPAKAKITGKLTKAGQPLQVSDKTQVTLVFAPDVEKPDHTYPAWFKPADGTFEVEVPPGKYRANLVIFDHDNKTMAVIPPEFRTKIYDLTTHKTLEIDISK